jgi:hypothetical protein
VEAHKIRGEVSLRRRDGQGRQGSRDLARARGSPQAHLTCVCARLCRRPDGLGIDRNVAAVRRRREARAAGRQARAGRQGGRRREHLRLRSGKERVPWREQRRRPRRRHGRWAERGQHLRRRRRAGERLLLLTERRGPPEQLGAVELAERHLETARRALALRVVGRRARLGRLLLDGRQRVAQRLPGRVCAAQRMDRRMSTARGGGKGGVGLWLGGKADGAGAAEEAAKGVERSWRMAVAPRCGLHFGLERGGRGRAA